MTLRILSPSGGELRLDVRKVFFPGTDGSFEVLEGHAALLAALGPGEIRWEGQSAESKNINGNSCRIKGGFVKVENNELKAAVEL